MTITEPQPYGLSSEQPTLREALLQLDQVASRPDGASAATAVDTLIESLTAGPDDLIDEIERSEPRLSHRIAYLRQQKAELVSRAKSVRYTLDHPGRASEFTRHQLAGLARAIRRVQSEESDIIFDALNTDLGAGD